MSSLSSSVRRGAASGCLEWDEHTEHMLTSYPFRTSGGVSRNSRSRRALSSTVRILYHPSLKCTLTTSPRPHMYAIYSNISHEATRYAQHVPQLDIQRLPPLVGSGWLLHRSVCYRSVPSLSPLLHVLLGLSSTHGLNHDRNTSGN